MTHPGSPNPSLRGRRNSLARLTSLLAGLGTAGLLAGCASSPTSHVVSAPPPQAPNSSVTTTTTTSTPVGVSSTSTGAQIVNSTIVTQAPPALQDEVTLARPTNRHLWLAGYWTWRNDRYEWMAGHWALPPTGSSTWVAPRWERDGNGYRFFEGYWN